MSRIRLQPDFENEAARIDAAAANVKARAEEGARRAVGKSMSIRGRDGKLYNGVIDTASVNMDVHPTRCGTTVRALFSVDLLCGATKFRKNFVVSKLPR